jgi:hypothetical protein
LGQATSVQTQSRRLHHQTEFVFCEAEQRFLLLFPEKEEFHVKLLFIEFAILLGRAPDPLGLLKKLWITACSTTEQVLLLSPKKNGTKHLIAKK